MSSNRIEMQQVRDNRAETQEDGKIQNKYII